jgi:RNA polymerase sigma-70 factor, ECF subfamily
VTPASPSEITRLLARARAGDTTATEQLIPLVYDELRRLARHYLQQENHAHTLQPTALVHEVYLQLFKPAAETETIVWQDRNHFFVVAARQMRRILVDHARAKHAAKREGVLQRVELSDNNAVALPPDADLLALNDVLSQLAELHPRPAQVVELRYFAGLTEKEAAEALGIGLTTLKREWEFARAWLFNHLKA